MRRRLIALALAGLLAAAPAQAWIGQKGGGTPPTPTTQYFFMSTTTVVSTTVTRWIPFAMAFQASNTELITFRFPIAGTITKMSMYATTTLTSGSYRGTIRIGAPGSIADSAATCSGATTTPCSWTGSVSVNAGDVASFRVDPSTSPAPSAGSIIHVVVAFQPATAGETVIGFGTPSNSFANNATQCVQAGSGLNPNVCSGKRNGHMPIAGTISNLYTAQASAPGTGKSFTHTVAKNGVDQSLQVIIADTATTASDTNAAHAITVTGPSGGSTPGDDIEYESAATNTPTASKTAAGVRFVPTGCSGCFPTFSAAGAAGTGGTTTKLYYALTSGLSAGSSTRSDAESLSYAMTIDGMTCKWSVAAGAGATRVCNLMVNGVTQLTCSITGASQTACNATGTVTINNGDKVVYEDDPTTGSTPAAAVFNASLLAHL